MARASTRRVEKVEKRAKARTVPKEPCVHPMSRRSKGVCFVCGETVTAAKR